MLIFIVDGTGDFSDSEYRREMAGSFCRQITSLFGPQTEYFRGPSLLGLEATLIARAVRERIDALAVGEKIYLVGYSRGGAAVIDAANSTTRKIEGVFLFDAVNRDVATSTDTINGTVRQVFHARRDPEFARRFEQESQQKQINLAKSMVTVSIAKPLGFPTAKAAIDAIEATGRDLKHKLLRSRTIFGNTGTKLQPPGIYTEKTFMETHGAIGGCPWPDVDGDLQGAKQVAAWMRAMMLGVGLRPNR